MTPEQGDGGGLSTTANTPPAAREAATSAIMIISLVLNNHTEGLRMIPRGPFKDLRKDPLIEASSIRSARFGTVGSE